MNRSRIVPLILLALATILPGCDGDSPTDPEPLTILSARTTESDEMAMWLARSPETPAELSERIAGDLGLLRDTFGDLIPELSNIHFRLPWEPNRVWLEVSPTLFDSVMAEQATVLEAVNARHGGTIHRPLDSYGFTWVFVDFDHTIHPGCLAAEYRILPGVEWAWPNGYGGDWSNLYPAFDEAESRYLLFKGDGDCPAGCTQNTYWYFRIENGTAVFVGTWDYHHPTPEPTWLDEATTLRHDYQTRGYDCDAIPGTPAY